MEGNLGKKDSSSVKDLQDPSMNGSNRKRRGSVQPSSRPEKKSKAQIDKDHRDKKKGETNRLKIEMEELKKSNWHLEGQAYSSRMDVKEAREEIIQSKIEQERQNNCIRELGKKLIESYELRETEMKALKEKHEQEIHDLKEKHEQEKLELTRSMNEMPDCNREMNPLALNAEHAQNNSMETNAIAQATSGYFDWDGWAYQTA